MTIKEYLTNNVLINATILSQFSFLSGTTVNELTNMIRIKYDAAEMYHTTEEDVLSDVTTVLNMYKDQLTKLYTSYNKVYDPEAGYSKVVTSSEEHSGQDVTGNVGESSTESTLATRTYDNNTLTDTQSTEASGNDSNTVTLTHGHEIEGEVTETGTLPITDALRNYVEFARFNFYEYVIDVIVRYITIPSFYITEV